MGLFYFALLSLSVNTYISKTLLYQDTHAADVIKLKRKRR